MKLCLPTLYNNSQISATIVYWILILLSVQTGILQLQIGLFVSCARRIFVKLCRYSIPTRRLFKFKDFVADNKWGHHKWRILHINSSSCNFWIHSYVFYILSVCDLVIHMDRMWLSTKFFILSSNMIVFSYLLQLLIYNYFFIPFSLLCLSHFASLFALHISSFCYPSPFEFVWV